MANVIREAVSKEKRRYQQFGFDLDLSYITPRIIAMGFPSEKFEAAYRNPLVDVLQFFETFHKGHYKVYNFCREKPYDGESKIKGEYEYFPFDDHNAPEFRIIPQLCKDVDEYLSADPLNVIALHCKAGKGRTGLMSAAFLVYMLDALNAHEAIDFYGTARTFNKKGVTIPSQLKYINYWSASLKHKFTVGDRTVKMTKIEMIPTPKISDEIFVKVSTFTEFVCEKSLTNSRKLTFKPLKESKIKMKEEEYMKLYDEVLAELKEENPNVTTREAMCAWDWKMRSIEGDERFGTDGSAFPIDPVTLHGDIKLEFSTSKGGIFNIWFNTWFIHDNHLEFSKMELDKGFKDAKQLAPNFKVILNFEDVSTAPSLEQEIPFCQVGVRSDIPDDIVDPEKVPPIPKSIATDPDVDAPKALLAETESSENPKRVKAPVWYPIYHTSLNFKNFNRIVDHLIQYPSQREFFNINPEMEVVKETTRDPLEVARSVLYSVIQLYLRSGFYGRCFDYHIELITLDNLAGVKLFEQQASELAVVDLEKLKTGENEPFWLNVYHIMLLHGLMYWKHRPNVEFKDMMSNFKKFAYKIGGFSYTLHDVLMGCLRAPWPKDSSIDKVVTFSNEKAKYVMKEADKNLGCLLSFGTTTSPGIWLYSVEDFAQQKEIAVNTYLNRQAAALGAKKQFYLMGNMKMFAKDYGGESAMKKELLQRHGVTDHDVKKWDLKYQSEDTENRVILDHLIAQNIVVTHVPVNFLGQCSLFRYEKPTVKDPKA
ncbi:phosphatidylinositol-3,4,5-trisphosphate 3-phosphatase and dual-specificity protein phosphatase PTEN, putative [Entamoeba invadens IP1]|uniref:Phosphatidylinositol 3,4,5-trisphosphate 3-phosphatase and dual-specificity protein phosphatase PTEN n=1 Tax=Entamoeba invadens IP1 TaxID=370355 RepID=A0A0A1UAV7_ENTIV|nr:phosphatidylinositol-3,4,5-trisphosphate 3-phosphatase and dual-specificity protein phosphatase PTEN, putative [Entamoeba invadens IP1]ELP92197.1 phosphatidylinositol-3,4,5-trisphosphate 3-phosphatase and dual-specificity protein phosphatase PTEN, putative [Entamoeba invadens IP1]|eukprot:XP_004258968.1 phosphatidylinositol-3,4,5-trisphosphate 3-phosphatase and dual-specificity protein phosphatase PTEN, putative [Entamoeba invadens IP1]